MLSAGTGRWLACSGDWCSGLRKVSKNRTWDAIINNSGSVSAWIVLMLAGTFCSIKRVIDLNPVKDKYKQRYLWRLQRRTTRKEEGLLSLMFWLSFSSNAFIHLSLSHNTNNNNERVEEIISKSFYWHKLKRWQCIAPHFIKTQTLWRE